MKRRAISLLAQMAVMALALSGGAVAQSPRAIKLSGTINDYTASGQIWEMRGTWSVKVYGDSGTADFTAELNMEHSDLGVVNGAARVPHTHHIRLASAQVISDSSYVQAHCPSAQYVPPTTTGFVVSGMASTTGNGGLAPFAPQGQQSLLTVCITGSDEVTYSNITLQFPATLGDSNMTKNPAAGHFGTQPINGVVRSAKAKGSGN
jgi:hypothetical protein